MINLTIPTVEKFNSWSLAEKAVYVDSETAGHAAPHRVGYLVYERENVFIEYARDGRGELKTATAETVKDVVQKLIMQVLAREAIKSRN